MGGGKERREKDLTNKGRPYVVKSLVFSLLNINLP